MVHSSSGRSVNIIVQISIIFPQDGLIIVIRIQCEFRQLAFIQFLIFTYQHVPSYVGRHILKSVNKIGRASCWERV